MQPSTTRNAETHSRSGSRFDQPHQTLANNSPKNMRSCWPKIPSSTARPAVKCNIPTQTPGTLSHHAQRPPHPIALAPPISLRRGGHIS
jgi:hypothetical protein